MYKTPDQARDFFRDFLPLVAGHDRDEIVVCPPFLAIPASVEAAKGSNVAIGAQNMHWEKEGAYTGEICCGMLLAVGVTHVIIGHSERRQYFGETDDVVNLKLKAALEAGLTAHRLCWRGPGGTGSRTHRGCLATAMPACFSCHLRQESSQTDRGLRTGVGDWNGQNCHSANGSRRPCT